MSLVGNFTSSYDRTAETSGSGTSIKNRRPSQSSEYPAELQHIKTSKSSIRPEDHGSSDKAVESSDAEDEAEVQKLARLYSHASTTIAENPFRANRDSVINPASEGFKARAWVKSMLKLREESENPAASRSAGVAFRNLSVYGKSATTDYQKTVGNYPLEVPGLARRFLGQGRRRVDILRNFEGLVRAGEMLVVLGPPGSGCSTFLKTIAGETHGFELEKDSYVNYQGVSYAQMHKNFRGEAIYTAELDVHFR